MRTSKRSASRPGATAHVTGADEKEPYNPFPGPRPFTEGDADVFFGREREVEHLLALLVVERAVLVHAPSGSGKSSLINASLIPRARAGGFHLLPVARVRDPLGRTRVHPSVANRYVSNVLDNWRDERTLREAPEAATLVELVSALGPAPEPGRVIVVDQFEELFLYPESWRDRSEVFRQIQAALDRDRLLRVLFVLRDDYLARLEPFTPLLRDRLRTRYAIHGLDPGQALAATVEPFRKAGMHFAPGAADAIVRGLLLQPADDPAAPPYEGEHVEPVQLQIVCRTLFERLADRVPHVDEITKADVDTYADVGQALAGFYDQAVTAATRTHRQVNERQIRLWFERRLITPSRARNRVLREAQKTGGLRNDVVDELEQRRVINSEPRGPDRWYELTHDRFVDAVLTSNRGWFTSPAGRDRRVLIWGLIAGLVPALVLCGVLLVQDRGPARGEEVTKSGEIVSADATEVFPISGKQGQLLTATFRPQGSLKGHLELFGTVSDLVATSADSVLPLASVTAKLGETGTYRLVASARDGTSGLFSLDIRLETIGSDDRPIEAGTAQDGTIDTPDQVDVYTFAGSKDSTVRITMAGKGHLDSALSLVAPGGAWFSDDDSGGGGDAALALILPETGTYSLRASSAGTSTGRYRLRLDFLESPVLDGRAAGDVSPRNPVQVYLVRTAGGGLGIFTAVPDPGLNVKIRLIRAEGSVLADVNNAPAGQQERFGYPLVPDATYLVLVAAADADNPGSYALNLDLQPPVALDDQARSGALRGPKNPDVYRFDADAGQVATVSFTSSLATPVRIDVFGPDGSEVAGASQVANQGTREGESLVFAARLAQRGPYLVSVVATATPESSPRYSLSVTRTAARPGS